MVSFLSALALLLLLAAAFVAGMRVNHLIELGGQSVPGAVLLLFADAEDLFCRTLGRVWGLASSAGRRARAAFRRGCEG